MSFKKIKSVDIGLLLFKVKEITCWFLTLLNHWAQDRTLASSASLETREDNWLSRSLIKLESLERFKYRAFLAQTSWLVRTIILAFAALRVQLIYKTLTQRISIFKLSHHFRKEAKSGILSLNLAIALDKTLRNSTSESNKLLNLKTPELHLEGLTINLTLTKSWLDKTQGRISQQTTFQQENDQF